MNKIYSIIFWAIYMILNAYFCITAEFEDPIQQTAGIIIGLILGALIDKIFYIIAYKITGSITSNYYGSERRSAIHWKIRIVLILIAFILGKIGIFEALLVQITQAICIIGENLYNAYLTELLEILL